jgi:uncharacterized protein
MKKILLTSIITLSFVMTSNAQDKATDLKTLFKLMNSEKMMDGMMAGIVPIIKQSASAKIKGNDSKEKFDKYMDFMTDQMKELSTNILNVELPLIYKKYFTHEDIKYLIQFYQSPTGKKMLEKTPEISKELMSSMMTKYIPDFQEKMTKKLEESK